MTSSAPAPHPAAGSGTAPETPAAPPEAPEIPAALRTPVPNEEATATKTSPAGTPAHPGPHVRTDAVSTGRPPPARRTAVEARSTGSTLGPDFVEGRGPWLYARDGAAWFDGTSGSGAATLGHQHPAVTAAALAQLGRLTHTGCKLGSEPRTALVERLGGLSPYAEPAVLPTATGAEAVESALKIARAATGNRAVVTFRHGYHGKTSGALALTWRAAFSAYSTERPDWALTAELPPARVPDLTGNVPDGFAASLAAVLEAAEARGGTAAVVLEPVQVTEGVLPVSPAVLDEIARQARERGALLVLDEIYTGLGRAGRLFAAEEMAAPPDLTLVGKTLGNGFPVSAVLGERAVLDALPPGVQTSTFSGHPVCCAAAVAVLDAVADEDVPGRARALGARLHTELTALAARHPWISGVRTAGALAAFDCVREDGAPDPERARAVTRAALDGRLLLFGGGPQDASVKIVPPALLTDDEQRVLADGLAAAAGTAAGISEGGAA